MEHAKKMILIPGDALESIQKGQGAVSNISSKIEKSTLSEPSPGPSSPGKSNATLAPVKKRHVLEILLKLAKISAYNSERHLRGENGSYLSYTNIIDYIEEAQQNSKTLEAEEQFIFLLREADINPNIIANQRMRSKLSQLGDAKIESISSANGNLVKKPQESNSFHLKNPGTKKMEDLEQPKTSPAASPQPVTQSSLPASLKPSIIMVNNANTTPSKQDEIENKQPDKELAPQPIISKKGRYKRKIKEDQSLNRAYKVRAPVESSSAALSSAQIPRKSKRLMLKNWETNGNI